MRLTATLVFVLAGAAWVAACSSPASNDAADGGDDAPEGAGEAREDATAGEPAQDAGDAGGVEATRGADAPEAIDATAGVDATFGTDAAGAVDAGAGLDAPGAADANEMEAEAAGADAAEPEDAGIDANVATDAAVAVDAGIDAPPSLGIDCDGEDAGDAAPTDLACTGLYDDWPARHVAPANVAYDPGLHLWSDGAVKDRWISLPPGTQIDTSDMDEWTFPVGTKIWKQFTVNGTLVETRMLWKIDADDWVFATYAWSEDQSSATRLDTGMTNVFGTGYEIPSVPMCHTCHEGRIDHVLGFEAVSLSTPGASGLTMPALLAENLLTDPPSGPLVIPGSGTAQAALSWLHANCGTACHNRSPNAYAGSTGLYMRLQIRMLAPGTVEQTDTYRTAVDVPSGFQPYPDAGFSLIAPGDPAHSCIPFRDGTRDDAGQGNQMPPIDSHVVDTADVATVTAWIASLPPGD